MKSEIIKRYRVYCACTGLRNLHRGYVTGPGTIEIRRGSLRIVVHAHQGGFIWLWSLLLSAATTVVLLALEGWETAKYGMAASFIVGLGLLEWLYPKRRRVFVVEDAAANLDMRESPRRFYLQVLPGRWIAAMAYHYADRSEMDRDIRELFEMKK